MRRTLNPLRYAGLPVLPAIAGPVTAAEAPVEVFPLSGQSTVPEELARVI
jgi:hypothetical protein